MQFRPYTALTIHEFDATTQQLFGELAAHGREIEFREVSNSERCVRMQVLSEGADDETFPMAAIGSSYAEAASRLLKVIARA